MSCHDASWHDMLCYLRPWPRDGRRGIAAGEIKTKTRVRPAACEVDGFGVQGLGLAYHFGRKRFICTTPVVIWKTAKIIEPNRTAIFKKRILPHKINIET
jgi:hypothetical protein